MWSLLAPVPNANPLEQHVLLEVRGGEVKFCALPTITFVVLNQQLPVKWWVQNKRPIYYPISNASTMPAGLPGLSYFFDVLGNVSSLNTCFQMELGFSICEPKVISISEQTLKKAS